jgi:hypothetical protein
MAERIHPPGWDPIAYLKGRHTKQLLGLKAELYRMNGGGRVARAIDATQASEEDYYLDVIGEGNSGCIVTLAEIKAELATRPHVPNKQEAKVIRQERAKASR